jgi:hypothetical protein
LNRRGIADGTNVERGPDKVFKKEKKDFFLFLNACFSLFAAMSGKFY